MNDSLPEWIDADLFSQWIEWRKEASKKKLTDKSLNRIVKLGITSLGRLKDQGFDPNRCIENTILNEWKGFFPYDRNQASNGFSGPPLSRADTTRAAIDELFATGTDANAQGGYGEAGQLRLVKRSGED